MATYNVQLMTKGVTDWSDGNTLYPKTTVSQISGFLSNGTISPSLLPSYIGGGLKQVGTFSSSDTLLNSAITKSGGGLYVGAYFVVTQAVSVADDSDGGTVPNQTWCFWDSAAIGDDFYTEENDIPISGAGAEISLEVGDFIVCTRVGLNGQDEANYFRIINNQYRMSTGVAVVGDGLLSSSDKTKLDGIATGANNYIHPTQSAISATTSGNEVIDSLYTNSLGHTTSVGKRTLSNASQTDSGLMSSTDKTKLDGIAANANNYVHPDVGFSVNTTTSLISHFSYLESNTIGQLAELEPIVEDLPIANQSADGLFSSTDKTKLDGIVAGANNYSHPTTTALSVDNTAVETMNLLTVDTLGHVTTGTSTTTQSIAASSTSSKGIVQLATEAETKAGLSDVKAVTPLSHKSGSLFWATDFPTYATLSAADAAASSHEVGKLVMVIV